MADTGILVSDWHLYKHFNKNKHPTIKYSRTLLARTRRDCQNLSELSEVRATEVP